MGSNVHRGDSRLLGVAMAVVTLLVLNAVVWSARSASSAQAAEERAQLARAAAAPVVLSPPPPPPPPPTSTTIVAPPMPAKVAIPRKSRPVDVPADSYANEPILRIGTIEIPKIGLTHPIHEGISLRNIDHGPSHWPGSALPGEPGNSVFAGHRVTRSHPFRRINELGPGDLVTFTINGRRSVYRFTRSEVVRPKDTWIANPTEGPTATLFACHPPGQKTFRYVVRLEMVSTG